MNHGEERAVTDNLAPFDVVVIGSGPGGYVAAIRAAQLGLRTCLVEKDAAFGGTCLHWGCIPTKAMLHAAEVLERTRHASRFGISVGGVSLDIEAMHSYKDGVVRKNARGVDFLLKKNGVETVKGIGRLSGKGTVEVVGSDGSSKRTLQARNIILATGSQVRDLPGVEFDGTSIISSDEALHLKTVPASMIVLGAGAVGVEFAAIYARFGSRVTLVELLPRVVPLEDEEISAELERAFRKRKIEVHTGTRVESVRPSEGMVEVVARKGDEMVNLSAEVLLVAVGRKPRIEGIGIEGTGVVAENGFVKVDGMQRTGEPGVYAIGDIVSTPQLAHVASHEGIIAAEHIKGLPVQPLDTDQIPSCTYCDPEIATIGLTEAEARRRGHEVAVGKFPFAALGKAAVLGSQEGFAKVVRETRYDQLLGVHLIGPHVTDLIAEAGVAMRVESTVEELFHSVHPHPTLSEALAEAALASHGRPIHIVQELRGSVRRPTATAEGAKGPA
jgi:dihydrolipoamide dehydrogenase